MVKKIQKERIKPIEKAKRKRINIRNCQLRISDENSSQRMLAIDQENHVRKFDNLFPDNEACDQRLLKYQGWEEVNSDNREGAMVLKFRCHGVLHGKPCPSEEAIKIPRKGRVIPRQQDGKVTSVPCKIRWVYQCKKCGTQFNLYKDTIFINRKGTDIWAWFLCLHTMYLLDGKMPRTWLTEKYINYLVKHENIILPDSADEKKGFNKKITERIRRITSKIQEDLFSDDTETSVFFRYKKLVMPETSVICTDYKERFEVSPKLRTRWKIAIRTKEYPKSNKELKEYAETEGVNTVYGIQYFNEDTACEIGDWILQIKQVPMCEKEYYFSWLHVDKILKIKSKRSEFKWQAIQVQKIPAFHFRPFLLTDKFEDAFVTAINDYWAEKGKELPLNKIIRCPDSMLDTIAFEF